MLTLDEQSPLHELLDGYDAHPDERDRVTRLLPLYRLVRWLGEIRWLAEHDLPDAARCARPGLGMAPQA